MTICGRFFHAAVWLGMVCGIAFGQASTSTGKPPLAFEVATIKPTEPNGPSCGAKIERDGRVALRCYGLAGLVVTGYNIPFFELKGVPDWAEKRMYTIVAQVPVGFPLDQLNTSYSNLGIADPNVREMIRTLLAERFHLQVHHEQRPGTVYKLVRTEKPTPLQPVKELPASDPKKDGGLVFAGEVEHVDGGWYLINESMADLAKYAANYVLHKPVIDATGMPGMYNYKTPESQRDPSEQGVGQLGEDSFKRMLVAVGLKLVAEPGQVETLVIDHAEPPTAN